MSKVKKEMTSRKQTALITGASGGIGLELARLFAADGHDVVLVARSTEKLKTLAEELTQEHGIRAITVSADLSVAGAAASLFTDVSAQGQQIDVLVNNAGYGLFGKFFELDSEEDSRMLQLNMVALTELTRLFGKGMIERGFGRILNVASTAAFQPGPLMATYYASKAFVLSFSEALANELEGSGVTVTALCPGPTKSGFQAKAQMEGSRLLKFGLMESAPVAKIGYKAMKWGKPIAIAGCQNIMLVQSVRLMPRRLTTWISRKVSERTA